MLFGVRIPAVQNAHGPENIFHVSGRWLGKNFASYPLVSSFNCLQWKTICL
jgi:hypothetical protein